MILDPRKSLALLLWLFIDAILDTLQSALAQAFRFLDDLDRAAVGRGHEVEA